MSAELLVQAMTLGPAATGLLWLLLSRWPGARRLLGGLAGLAAHAAAWAVFWRLYQGEVVSWRGLEPDLLRASVIVFAEIGVLFAAVRAERLPGGAAAGAIVALGVATSAMAYGASTTGLVTLAMLAPVGTLAAAAAGLTGTRGRHDLAGIAGLAASDALVIAGLSVVLAEGGSTVLGAIGGHGPGTWLLLLGAAAKVGALPGIGTWRVSASDGPAATVAAAVRGHGIALLALAAPTLAGFAGDLGIAAAAALVAFACGTLALRVREAAGALSAALGAGACVPFLAIGLGGAIGFRAFLLTAPAFLLAAAVASAVGGPPAEDAPRGGRWLGAIALAVAVTSLAGLPPGGGFPGTWLTLDLIAVRAEGAPWLLGLAGLTAAGLLTAAIAVVPLLRTVRPPRFLAALGALGAAALLYMGSAPLRLGIGWLIRVERGVGAPEILPASGAPALPALPAGTLLRALVPAAAIVLVVILLGRGLRGTGAKGFVPMLAAREPSRLGRRVAAIRTEAERLFLGVGFAMLLEVGAVIGIVRLVLLGAHQGFL